jgi:hypothetical protein
VPRARAQLPGEFDSRHCDASSRNKGDYAGRDGDNKPSA